MPSPSIWIAGSLAVVPTLLVLAACAPIPQRPANESGWPQEETPANYVAPARFDTLQRMLPQLHAVVVGKVSDISFDYDDCWGPRTVVKVEGVRSLVGSPALSTLKLAVFGGPLPDGRWIEVSELPRYVMGARYVLFLRNTDWRYSPVMGDLAYRLESIAGKEVLLTTDGRAVTGLSEDGVETLTKQLAGAVGLQVMGAERSKSDPFRPTTVREDNGRCTAAQGVGCGPVAPNAAEDVRRGREQILASRRFAAPPMLPGTTTADVAQAWSVEDLRRELMSRAAALNIEIGGRFIDRPRLGCWRKTPLIRWESRHADIVNASR